MTVAFYLAAAVAVLATVQVVASTNAVHALLSLIVSLLAVAVVFYVLGAPFAAALEAIVYAGAIMVLFAFVVMMLNLGAAATLEERAWLGPRVWLGPGFLSAVLLGLLVFLLRTAGGPASGGVVAPQPVGAALFGPYVLAVELASMLLLAGLVAAFHLGR